jgi:N-acetylmuramic acid 6-phosphate (MurNAc-6-P) etherase
VIWQGSQWTAAIAQNRRDIDRLTSDYVAMAKSAQDQAVQLARIEENTRNSAQQIENLVRSLEQSGRLR